MNIMVTDFAFFWILFAIGSVVYDFLSYDARVKRAQGKTPARSDAWWVKLLDI